MNVLIYCYFFLLLTSVCLLPVGVDAGKNSMLIQLGLMALFCRNRSKGGSISTTYTQKNDQTITAVWCSSLESLGIFLSSLSK